MRRNKAVRAICLTLGILLVCLNLLIDITNPALMFYNSDSQAHNVGYFIGSQVFGIVALVFLAIAYNQHKKILKKQQLIVEQEIELIGKNMEDGR